MVSLDYFIFFSEYISDNVLTNAMAAIFWPRWHGLPQEYCPILVKRSHDVSARSVVFTMQQSRNSIWKRLQDYGLPETLFLQRDQSCIRDLNRSTHDSQVLESHLQLPKDCLHGEIDWQMQSGTSFITCIINTSKHSLHSPYLQKPWNEIMCCGLYLPCQRQELCFFP